jgi:hypothetical protein
MCARVNVYTGNIFEVVYPEVLVRLRLADYDLIIIDEVDAIILKNRLYRIVD